ncbi:hypothetical protein [Dyella silvatica]|uniref:hypothetical protein n=1 Tax=Dyella silvatica TaxID=2992128 RepID=UPI00224CC752|nr:hypothetical protein [Dyella silvatica]
MSIYPPVEVWNGRVISLMQALLGTISPNYRMVSILYENDVWILRFVLEVQDEVDLDEINDTGAEFEAFEGSDFDYQIRVEVFSGLLMMPSYPERVVYRRREVD